MEISPNQYTSAEVFKNGDLTIYATIFNLGVNVVPVSEADIAGITLDSFYLEDTDLTASLPGGITMDSTIDDVIAAYGEPSSRYDGDTLTSLDYTYASYQDVSFSFDSESGAMTGLELRNLVASEEDGDAASEINEDAPEVVAQYQAPTELGTDLRACTLELEGTLYQLPAPVRVFLGKRLDNRSGRIRRICCCQEFCLGDPDERQPVLPHAHNQLWGLGYHPGETVL